MLFYDPLLDTLAALGTGAVAYIVGSLLLKGFKRWRCRD